MRRCFYLFVVLLISAATSATALQRRPLLLRSKPSTTAGVALPAPVVVVPDQLEHMTVPQLKEQLKAKGLPVTGLKQVLIERLRVSGASSSGPAPAAIDDEEPAHSDANFHANAHARAHAPVHAEADDLDAFFDDEVLPIHAQQPPSSSSSTSRGGQRPQRDPSAPAADVDAIQLLCSQRNELRYQRDFDGADAVRAQLEAEHGVVVYDYKNQWVAPDGSTGALVLKTRNQVDSMFQGSLELPSVPAAEVPTTLTEEQIMALCRARTAARRSRNYDEADAIRDELAENGVELYDTANAWRTHDGRLRGDQSDDFDTYRVTKDRGRGARGGGGDWSWGDRGRGGGGGGGSRSGRSDRRAGW